MRILGIETSCDETAAAVVEDGERLLSNVVNSQIDIHAEYGGVVPEVAARSHLEVINPVVNKALVDAGCTWDDIDAIAVTYAPGLIGSLMIGSLATRTLAIIHKKPLYKIHHVEAHVYANFIISQDKTASLPTGPSQSSVELRPSPPTPFRAASLRVPFAHAAAATRAADCSEDVVAMDFSSDTPEEPADILDSAVEPLASELSEASVAFNTSKGNETASVSDESNRAIKSSETSAARVSPGAGALAETRSEAVSEDFGGESAMLLVEASDNSAGEKAMLVTESTVSEDFDEESARLILPTNQPTFPLLALIVSGGHTQLAYFKNHGDFRLIGQTQDDAVGEAFDKVAKILGLPYPGGPSISKAAELGNPKAFNLPIAKLSGKYDFSFSGLKTAVLRAVQREVGKDFSFPSHELPGLVNDKLRYDMAASFQYTAIKTLVRKAKKAFDELSPASVVIAGGVAANTELRRQLSETLPINIEYAPIQLCTDNAAMIATLGYYRSQIDQPADPFSLEVEPSLSMLATATEAS